MIRCLYSPGVRRLGAAGEMFRIPAYLDHLSIEPCMWKKVGAEAAEGTVDSGFLFDGLPDMGLAW